MEKKRRQHYVWKNYLKPWSKDGHVYICSRGEIERKGLKLVGQKDYFYKLKEISEADVEWIKNFINQSNSPSFKKTNLGFISMFNTLFQLKRHLNTKQLSNAEFEKELKILEVNLEENFHSIVETKSTKYLQMILDGNSDFFKNDKDSIRFLHFLSLQYFRTNNMQKRQYSHFKPIGNESIVTMWPILRHVFALNVASSIYNTRENYQLIILENNSDVDFITSDQPVINTYSITSNGQDGLEFYYPVTPKIAILVTEKTEYKASDSINLNKNEVLWFNQAIVEACDEQIYATNLESLMMFKKPN